MIPLHDDVPRTTWPWVTVTLILANCAVFYREVSLEPFQLNALIESYAIVPARTVAFFSGLPVSPQRALLPFFTAMFLHGGWLHLIGNMWFLWIFGDNVEDRVGHMRFVIFYLACGLAASAVYVFLSPESTVPSVGASGAIAGVMGAYLITFPGARVKTLIPIFIFPARVEIRAYIILVYWFLLQFLSGVASIQSTAAESQGGGVAWFAHVGGFAAGIPLMLLLRPSRRKRTA